MIEKEHFFNFINYFNTFDKSIQRIGKAMSGKSWSVDLFESDWCEAVYCMLEEFIKSYFTEAGEDLINYYMFEDYRQITDNDGNVYNLETLEDLWQYLNKYSEDYCL